MKVDWYDEVSLKDGRKGCVIEIYETDNNVGYEIELSYVPDDSETVVVTEDAIDKIIKKNKL